jgi:hypothetical protein
MIDSFTPSATYHDKESPVKTPTVERARQFTAAVTA